MRDIAEGGSELELVLEALALDKRLRSSGVALEESMFAEQRALRAEARVKELEGQLERITGGLRSAIVALSDEADAPRILGGEVG